ncbi:hypothetical protein NQ315_001142 [Exocentrus adspersus]|uniref:Uncharacterized protein n=1 Tax=Exocentrus adspersus TaxID=1586481 RepID=A0AAV8WEH2_9CUCU|nr:hypothetical protein NQ315_001142 [Exocentrus adspersus]
MSSVPAIGIDLGTTFSCISVYRNGRPELIPNFEGDGDRLTPSVLYFHPITGETSLGRTAEQQMLECPKNCLFDAKRFIGRSFDDEFISRYQNSKRVHFELVRGDDDNVVYEIEVANKRVVKKPEEVSCEILKHLKRTADDYVGEPVTKAVISVPAYFSNAQRKATKQAAELAGLEVLKLVTEPTAAAVHYVLDKNRKTSNILAFDFGGGTLDVSLIKVHDNTFQVKAVYGDTLLGGRNYDEILFDHFYAQYSNQIKDNFRGRSFKRRLSEMCTELKKKLSIREEYTMVLERYDGEADCRLSLTRAKFEYLCRDIFKRVMDTVELCLHDSGLGKSDINEVILVGGSSRIPKIRETLKSYFGADKIKTDLNPEEAVAAGASIHAAFLLGDCQDLEKFKVTEVTPMSLGISTAGNLMNVFLAKNSALPARNSKDMCTVFNDQSGVGIPIYEGERKNTMHNNKLGEFTLTNLPKERAGDVIVSVNFDLNQDGILNVTATEKSTGNNNKLVVTMGQFRFSERRIKLTLADAKKHKIEDEVFEKFVLFKARLQERCQHVLYDINKIASEADRSLVKEQCQKFMKESEELDFTETDRLEAKFAVYNAAVSDILRKNSMLQLQ